MTQTQDLSLELKKILPELQELENKADGKLSKEERDALEKPTENILVEPLLNIFHYNTKSITSPNRAESQYKIGSGQVDFALIKDNQLVILVEVKRVGEKLDSNKHHAQLKSYFNGTDQHESPKFGVLTNGNRYDFYASKNGKIDSKPCFTFVLKRDYDNQTKISKLSEILGNVNEEVAKNEKLYTNTRAFIESVIKEGEDETDNKITNEFIRYGILEVAKRNDNPLHEGTNIMPQDIENTKKLVFKIFDDIIKDRVNQKWDDMRESENKTNIDNSIKTGATKFVDAERDALGIIKAISAQMIDPNDVTYEDYQTTCAIFVKSKGNKNGRICTLKKFDNARDKYEIKFSDDEVITIAKISELYKYSEKVLSILKTILNEA